MVVADIIIGPLKPPVLHTDEQVRAIGMPDLKPGRPETKKGTHTFFQRPPPLHILRRHPGQARSARAGTHCEVAPVGEELARRERRFS